MMKAKLNFDTRDAQKKLAPITQQGFRVGGLISDAAQRLLIAKLRKKRA